MAPGSHPSPLSLLGLGEGDYLCVPCLCLCSSGRHVSRGRVLWEPSSGPERQTASPSADQMGLATPTVALQHPTDTSL